jgi:hypothetical protein
MVFHRVVLAALALAVPCTAGAGVLYKSVAADGSIMFSDTPPPASARIVEQRVIADNGTVASAASSAAARTLGAIETLFDSDAALSQANERIDMAEHALAEARRSLWSYRDGLRLKATSRAAGEDKRIESLKHDVLAARQQLLDLLRERRAQVPEPGAPRVVSGPYTGPLVTALTRTP